MSEEISELIKQRIHKIDELREKGIHPYPMRFKRTATSQQVVGSFKEETPETVVLAGRLKSKRVMGKASFAVLEDYAGTIQLYAKKDALGDENYDLFKTLDLGDQIGITGTTFRTHTGEITVNVSASILLAKCIQPLPAQKEKDGKVFHEFADKEMKYRQRYVDLIINKKTREDFILRSRIIAGIRSYLMADGFLEVETPMMQSIAGGAAAKPFITHHNALDMKLYLRIAPELYLKRLVVGGLERVFELNRNFRNEGIDSRHNPEFTMVELYQAYADYQDMMNLAESMISTLAKDLLGKTAIEYEGHLIELAAPWKRIGYVEIIKEKTGIDFSTIKTVEEARAAAAKSGVKIDDDMGIWKIADEIFSERAESSLIQPTFLTDYPKELSPLSKSREDNPDYVERFELFMAGREMANAFTELNDPFDQKERFLEQVRMREEGDDEAQMMDNDFVTALEYGLPPTGGMGIGIDRLVMLFVGTSSIKDTILFPLLKQEQ